MHLPPSQRLRGNRFCFPREGDDPGHHHVQPRETGRRRAPLMVREGNVWRRPASIDG